MYWDEKLGKFVEGLPPQKQQDQTPVGMSYLDRMQYEFKQQEEARYNKENEDFNKRLRGDKPLFASNPAKEAFNIAGNALTGLATDYVDLASGLFDAGRAGLSAVTGQKRGDALYFDPTEIFNDADNPLTQWRRETFKTESEAGEAVSGVVRLVTSALTLPKIGVKAGLAPIRAAGKIAGVADKVENVVAKVGARFAQPQNVENVVQALKAVEFAGGKAPAVGKAAQKAIATVRNNSYLYATLEELGTAAKKGSQNAAALDTASRWMANTGDAVTRIFRLPGKSTVRTVGQALAWDAFVAFNVAGEGDQSMDETIGDMLATSGNPWLEALGRPTTTYATDPAIVTKLKQMGEGLFMGGALEAALGMGRIWRFANDFRRASPEEQAKLLAAFKGYSQSIGEDLSKALPGAPEPLLLPEASAPTSPENLQRFVDSGDPKARQYPWSTEPPGALVRDGVVPADVQIDEPAARGVQALTGAPEPPLLPEGKRGLPGTAETDTPRLPGAGGTDGATAPEALQRFVDSGDNSTFIAPQTDRRFIWTPAAVRDAVDSAGIDPRFVWTPAAVREAVQKEMSAVFRRTLEPGAVAPDPLALPQWTAAGLRQAIESVIEMVSSDKIGLTPENVKAMQQGIVKMLPGRRVDLMDLLMQDQTVLNGSGMHNAADGIWKDYITTRALDEGWGTVDGDFQILFKRSDALRMDREDLAFKQADALDNVLDDNEFPVTPIDQNAAEDIAQQEAMKVAGDKAMREGVPIDLQQQALIAAQEADDLANSEAARSAVLKRASDVNLTQRLTDEQAVEGYLGRPLSELIEQPTVQKVEGGRQWEVIRSDGSISRSNTKRDADRLAQQDIANQRKFIVNQARNKEIDDTAQAMGVRVGNPVVESEVTGKIGTTEAQRRAALGLDPKLDALLQGVTGKTGSIVMSVTEMNRLQGVLKAAAEQATGSTKNALNKLNDRIGVAMKTVEPEARAQQRAQGLLDQARIGDTAGEFCNWAD